MRSRTPIRHIYVLSSSQSLQHHRLLHLVPPNLPVNPNDINPMTPSSGSLMHSPLSNLSPRLGHPRSKPTPIMIYYRYENDSNENATTRKSRCSLRGDLIASNLHYDADKLTNCAVYKSTIRFLLALSCSRKLHSTHFYIKSFFTYEKSYMHHPFYVIHQSRFNGICKHPHRIGKFLQSLYG